MDLWSPFKRDKDFNERFAYTEDHRGRPFVEIQFIWEQKLSGENWFKKGGACWLDLSRMKNESILDNQMLLLCVFPHEFIKARLSFFNGHEG